MSSCSHDTDSVHFKCFSYTRDGILYLKPTFTSDTFGEEFLKTEILDIWGGQPGDKYGHNNVICDSMFMSFLFFYTDVPWQAFMGA